MRGCLMSGVEREVVLFVLVDDVWAALTTPEGLSVWFGAIALEIESWFGGCVIFQQSDKRWRGIVEAADRPALFAFRWLPAAGDERTRVEFHLQDRGDETRLVVREVPAWQP